MSHYGWVSTGHPFTTHIGLEALKAGGNAFDAATAAGYAASLSEPLLTSLGGGGLMVAQTPKENISYNFFTNFPGLTPKKVKPQFTEVHIDFESATQKFKTGTGSIAVPGTIKGLLYTHEKHGQVNLQKLLKPIIKSAKEGLALNHTQSYTLQLLSPIALLTQEGREIYAPQGSLLNEGELLINRNYAQFLENVEKLTQDVYHGQLAQKILDISSDKNTLSTKDLSHYKVISSRPLSFEYNKAIIYTAPPPAHGGHYLKLLFAFLENQNLQDLQHGSYKHIKAISDVLVQLEQGKSYEQFHPFTKGTTHISVADTFGNCVSLSLTNGEGSGVFIPDTGIMLNNMLGEDDICSDDPKHWKAGQRLPSMMAPCIVNHKNKARVITGSGGSKRIRSSLLQVICNLLDFNLNVKEAILAPRINWDGDRLQMEAGYSPSVIEKIKHDYPISLWNGLDFYFGGTHTVIEDTDAFGDPRREGYAE